MSQEDNKKQIEVKLFLDGGVDYLEFNLDGKAHKLNLNLEDNQSEIKRMFIDLIPLLKSSAVELTLNIQEGYENGLLKDVSQSYISDLNKELDTVRAEIIDENEADE
jgi:hypothetical protein